MNSQVLELINNRIKKDKCIICDKFLPKDTNVNEYITIQYNRQPVIVCKIHNQIKE